MIEDFLVDAIMRTAVRNPLSRRFSFTPVSTRPAMTTTAAHSPLGHHKRCRAVYSAGLLIILGLLSQQTDAHFNQNFRPAQLQQYQSSGSWCRTRLGQWGRCTPFSECPLQQRGEWGPTPPTTCSPLNSLPLVCCPTSARMWGAPRRRTPPARPSRNQSSAAIPTTTTTRPTPTTTTLPPITATSVTTSSTDKDQYECGRTPGTPPSFSGSVVGGREVEPHSRPWMAALGRRSEEDDSLFWFCGGILITPTTVLTAAHCLQTKRLVDVVRVGGHDLTAPNATTYQDLSVQSAVTHSRYRPPALAHDLAMLFLARPAAITSSVVPVCLPSLPRTGEAGSGRSGALRSQGWDGLSMRVTGWGSEMYDGGSSPVLREASVTVFPLTSCRKAYSSLPGFRTSFPGGLSESFVCAGDVQGDIDACQGDSGGPLVYEGGNGGAVLAGVVAAGFGCGVKEFPGLYTSTLAHLRWIQSQLRHEGKSGMPKS